MKKNKTTFFEYLKFIVLNNKKIFYYLIILLFLSFINNSISIRINQTISDLINSILKSGESMELYKLFSLYIFLHYTLTGVMKYLTSYVERIYSKFILINSLKNTMKLDYHEFHSTGSGKVQENLLRGAEALSESLVILMVEIPDMIIFVYLSSSYMFRLFNRKTAIFIIFSSMLAAFVAIIIGFFISQQETIWIESFNHTICHLNDILHNYDVVKSYNREKKDISIYSDKMNLPLEKYFKYSFKREMASVMQKILTILPHIIVMYFLIKDSSVIGLKEISFVVSYNGCYAKFRKIMTEIRDLIFSVLKKNSQGSWVIKTNIKNQENQKKMIKIKKFNTIRMKDISIYADKTLLKKNINVNINRGDCIALIGKNGAGKSSFLKCLLGFYKSTGVFLVDTIPFQSIEINSYRDLISYVPQEPCIFNDTVLKNLSYAMPYENPQQIFKLCKEFNYHDFFKNMKDGYNTVAGENGKFLSGGQRQRINFMRAVIKNCPLIILDEPSSSLDKLSEEEMMKNIHKLNKRNITVILIHHNTKLLKEFKKIFYFNNEGIEVYDYKEYKNLQENKL